MIGMAQPDSWQKRFLGMHEYANAGTCREYLALSRAFRNAIEAGHADEIAEAYAKCCTDDGSAVKKADEYAGRWHAEWIAAAYEDFSKLLKSCIAEYSDEWQAQDPDGLWMTFASKPEFYSGKAYLEKHGDSPKTWTDLDLYRGILGAMLHRGKKLVEKPGVCEANAVGIIASSLLVPNLSSLISQPGVKTATEMLLGESMPPSPGFIEPNEFLKDSKLPGAKLLYKIALGMQPDGGASA